MDEKEKDTLMSGINAVVLAGGRGTRLSPLTDTIPKPLAPIAGRSAFERILDLLADNGITHAAVTTGYMAQKLKSVTHPRVKLTFFEEKAPLGTAGAVKNAQSALKDTFLVISGDALCDFDLRDAVLRHAASGAKLTVLLTRSADVTEYGTVTLDSDGFIKRFVEKPPLSKAVSDLVNSGIYIMDKSVLELIGDGEVCDFSKDLFPRVMKTQRINAVVCEGYWCDIGDLFAYYRCNEDAYSGKIKMSGRRSAAGKNLRVGKGAKLIGSIIHDDVSIGEGSVVCRSILCDGAQIGTDCRIGSGSIVGAGAHISDGVSLGRSSRIKPGAH
ncbi:MAG TPA: NDP-sugar synthase, partial [Bacillota bacterium]|nr:NDP-sugar synthase [Bacillota bacterium]